MDCAAVSRLGTNAPVSTSRYSRIAILFSAQPTMQRSCEEQQDRSKVSACGTVRRRTSACCGFAKGLQTPLQVRTGHLDGRHGR